MFSNAKVKPGMTYRWTPPPSPYQKRLDRLRYEWYDDNGVNPAQFEPRAAATKVLGLLPETLAEPERESTEEAADEKATLPEELAEAADKKGWMSRLLIHGPPASGKSSIMGNLYESLKVRYHPVPVYYVPAAAAMSATTRGEIYDAIESIKTCVVLLDDAQEWYDQNTIFFGLFKGQSRILVAAATFPPQQFNPRTPVNFQDRVDTGMTTHEISLLLNRLGVAPEYHTEMQDWYGDIYGRYHFLVPTLLAQWEGLKKVKPNTTLADTFFRAATMQDMANQRFLPVLDRKFKPLVIKVWDGTANDNECAKLVPYGILKANREWSCEYIRRKYFFDLFQSGDHVATLFDRVKEGDVLPTERDIAEAGLLGINWNRLTQSKGSSGTGFPVEDIWQAEFYGAIGKYIIRPYTFCKEYATSSGRRTGSIDFVLRNGQTRAIEFLIKSDRVSVHHERFWAGAYTNLFRLSGSYLVVDIKPWDRVPDIDSVSDMFRCEVATSCFRGLKTQHRLNHAVYLVSNSCTKGILFTFDEPTQKAVVYADQVALELKAEEA